MCFNGFWCSPVRRNPAAKRVWCGSTKLHTISSQGSKYWALLLPMSLRSTVPSHAPASCPEPAGTGRFQLLPTSPSFLPFPPPFLAFPFLLPHPPLAPPSLPISPLSSTALSSSAVPLGAAPGGRRRPVNVSCDLEIPG